MSPKVVQGMTDDCYRRGGTVPSLLLQHANGERQLKVNDNEALRALRSRRLIRFDRAVRPWRTIITPRGKEVLTALLAGMAEVLVAREAAQEHF